MKSVGNTLLSARKKEGYTIDDVHRAIKIHPKYIKALEQDNYEIFDGKVHAKGFLKVYAEYLGLDLAEILALWRREYEPVLENGRAEKYTGMKSLEAEKFVITPGMLFASFLIVFLIGFFSYLFFQYRDYADSPTLDIFHPDENYVSQTDVLDITGRVELDSDVFINDQKIINNPDGSFLTSIKLREGINTISIKAVNKLNRETEVIRTIIYRPEREEPTLQILDGTDDPTDIDGSSDGLPINDGSADDLPEVDAEPALPDSSEGPDTGE